MDEPTTSDAARIYSFYQECLRNEPGVASMELIGDSQTKQLLDAIFALGNDVSILDYGCGNLRLLNALRTRPEAWTYKGLDLEDPALTRAQEIAALGDSDERVRRSSFSSFDGHRRNPSKHDVAVVLNVFHELPIVAMATVVEDLRRSLREDGRVLLMDTVLLPEGEPRFVPMYPWEVELVFGPGTDRTYTSRSGIPILFVEVSARSLGGFHSALPLVSRLVPEKRDVWTQISIDLNSNDRLHARRSLGLGTSQTFDYAYLNTIIANANFRASELGSHLDVGAKVFDACACAFVRVHAEHWDDGHGPMRLVDAYDRLASEFAYATIFTVLDRFERSLLFFRMQNGTIQPTDKWDKLEEVGLNVVETRGLEYALMEVQALLDGEFGA